MMCSVFFQTETPAAGALPDGVGYFASMEQQTAQFDNIVFSISGMFVKDAPLSLAISVCPFACLHATTRKPLNGFSLTFI
jgi:hypothetical protein